jgi:hypothetical protein
MRLVQWGVFGKGFEEVRDSGGEFNKKFFSQKTQMSAEKAD